MYVHVYVFHCIRQALIYQLNHYVQLMASTYTAKPYGRL